VEWVLLQQTDSTNRVAKELARQGAAHGTAVLALAQTAGRGRLERQFYSPEGGLYLSVILRPKIPPQDRVLVTPMAAVAVCHGVEHLCGIRPDIKWVNDLYLEGKKLCGILCEGTGDAVIVGIGLNLRSPEGGFPPQLNATALDTEIAPQIFAETIAEELLMGCETLLDRAFLQEYREKNLVLHREVTVYPINGESFAAKAVDIDDHCRLVVETAAGRRLLDSGEITIRL